MAKKTYIGISSKSKEVPSIGYVGIPVNGVGKSKRLLKGYIGDANDKAKLFWEYGGGLDHWFRPHWYQNYIKENLYDLNKTDIEKTIKYPIRRALWLSDGVDNNSYEFFMKYYANMSAILNKVNELIDQDPTLDIVIVYFNTRLPEDAISSYQIYLCSADLTDKKCYDGSQRTGGSFQYNFRYPDGTYRVIDYHKLIMVEFYSSGGIYMSVYDSTNYSDVNVQCSNTSNEPYGSYSSNIGIYFDNEEETDLVDYIEFRNGKRFGDFIVSDYSLNSASAPATNPYYNYITVDQNGATFTNDVSFMKIPEWWVFGGFYYIELDMGYMPSSVATNSNYIMLLEFVGHVGIAYNKTAGVWGIWDRERTTDIFRPSLITALDYFANSKVRICFDSLSGTISVYKDNVVVFVLPFIYGFSSSSLYIGGSRTVSAQDRYCVAGMVLKYIKVYKNKLYHNIIKKAYHDADPYISDGMFDIPVTLSNSTAFSFAMRIYEGSTLTNYYTYENLRLISSSSKVYLALLHSRQSGGDIEYFAVYVSKNPFVVEMHIINGYTGTDTTNNFSSNSVTLNGITYYFLYQSVGWKNGGASWRHRNYNCSFNLSITSGTSANGGNINTLWQLAYLIFTGTIVDY